jgi:hypothetical protein
MPCLFKVEYESQWYMILLPTCGMHLVHDPKNSFVYEPIFQS